MKVLIVSAHWEDDRAGNRVVEEVHQLLRPRMAEGTRGAVVSLTEEQTQQPGLRRDLWRLQLDAAFEGMS